MSQFQVVPRALPVVVSLAITACSGGSQPPTSPTAVLQQLTTAPSGSSPIGLAPPPGHVDVFPRQANGEAFEVCKDYVGGAGPAVTITVAADIGNNGSVDATYSVTLADGECQDVWLAEQPGDLVTVTEAVPSGYMSSYVRSLYLNGTITTDPSVQGNSASGLVAGSLNGVLVVFTNTAVPPPPDGVGRFTGGGSQIRIDGVRITRGLTIHCDLLLSNNLEVNWNGNSFHMTEHLNTVECSDDPNIIQAPPQAPLDTLIGVGTGRYNNVDGFTIEFTLVDKGEPGTNDQAALLIYETANPSNVVLNVPLQNLDGGNLQAHFDQPHQ